VHLFFTLSSLELALILIAIVFGATALGVVLGRAARNRSEHLREPLGVLQGALLSLVALVLAFGLALSSTTPTRSARPTSGPRRWPSRCGRSRSTG
jgi:hypothetical protein